MLVVFLRQVGILQNTSQIQLHFYLHFPQILEVSAICALSESLDLKEEVSVGLVKMDGLPHSPLLVAGLAKPFIAI